MRVAINGFGRIGRCVLRAIFEEKYDDVSVVAINSGSVNTEMDLHLLNYDSTHGHFQTETKFINENEIKIGSKLIKFSHERNLQNTDWSGIDVVLECTGSFLSKEKAYEHIAKGAKKVILSAPAKDVQNVVWRINDSNITDDIISIGSCTTNCLAPIAKVINDSFVINSGFMTTVHAYTNDQKIIDGSHKSDFRRARAAALSIIPTSTGAAKSISLVIPELEGKLDGSAVRVPTANVSMVDLSCVVQKHTTQEEVNSAFKFAAENNLKGMLSYCDKPLVSIDFNHSKESSIFDSIETRVVNGNFIRVVGWYDNEWSFALRMLDIARLIKK
jgi:glyceraldehyde 3-phosphate dehydrogenase